MRRALALARPYRGALAAGIAAMLLESAAALSVPWIGGSLAQAILGDHGAAAIRVLLLALLGAFTVLALLRIVSANILEGVADRIVADLKVRLYEHLQALPIAYFHRRRLGDNLALLTNDVYAVSAFVSDTAACLPALLLTAAGASVCLLTIQPTLALLPIAVVPLFYFALKVAGRRLRPLSSRLHEEEARAIALAQENLDALPAIKSNTREAHEAGRFRERIEAIVSLAARQRRIRSALSPLAQLVAAAGFVLVLGIATTGVGGLHLEPAQLVAFLLFAQLLTRPVGSLADVYGHTQSARGAMERLDRVMQEPPEPAPNAGSRLHVPRGEIEFRDVWFAYEQRPPALRGVRLTVRPGETLAIVGPNGAGKSTLAHLLMRLHDPSAGQVLVDGTDIAQVSTASLRSQVGVVPQHVILFHASVRENIAYGRLGADAAAIEAAARAARAHDFIEALPQGYETVIGDRGLRLSGGQRQRVALARALLKDPPILVLDEATAMFDPEGEEDFLRACRDLLRRRTVILITHRPASLRVADRIVSLADGQVVDIRPAERLRVVGQDD